MAAEWMSDLKEGFCPAVGYYNKEACCWFNNEVSLHTLPPPPPQLHVHVCVCVCVCVYVCVCVCVDEVKCFTPW